MCGPDALLGALCPARQLARRAPTGQCARVSATAVPAESGLPTTTYPIVLRGSLLGQGLMIAVAVVATIGLLCSFLVSRAEGDAQGMVWSAVLTVVWAAFLWRSLISRVEILESGLVLYGVLQTRRIIWPDLDDVVIGQWLGRPANYVRTGGARHLVPILTQVQRDREVQEQRALILGSRPKPEPAACVDDL